jgi:ribosomal protein S18 acetylase RimI-like enzyme
VDSQLEYLDNPVWYALEQTHLQYREDYGDVRFYSYPFATFGAIRNQDVRFENIIKYAAPIGNVIIVGEFPRLLPSSWSILKEAHCAQMVYVGTGEFDSAHEQIIMLDQQHQTQLYQLINTVQPGYFFSKTQELGQYFGIFKDGHLVAAAGERLRLSQFSEISGVVTHPDYVKRGFATQLVAHACSYVLRQNKTPFLHVLGTNSSAIGIYEKLGFRTRRTMVWYLCGPTQSTT